MCLFFFLGVHEFPEDIFTNQERIEGAVALHIVGVSVSLFVFLCVCVCVGVCLSFRHRQMQKWPVFSLMQVGAGDQV